MQSLTWLHGPVDPGNNWNPVDPVAHLDPLDPMAYKDWHRYVVRWSGLLWIRCWYFLQPQLFGFIAEGIRSILLWSCFAMIFAVLAFQYTSLLRMRTLRSLWFARRKHSNHYNRFQQTGRTFVNSSWDVKNWLKNK